MEACPREDQQELLVKLQLDQRLRGRRVLEKYTRNRLSQLNIEIFRNEEFGVNRPHFFVYFYLGGPLDRPASGGSPRNHPLSSPRPLA